MYYFYENHLGGIYWTTVELENEALYCEQCGDSDWPIGKADTYDEAKSLLLKYFKENHYSKEYEEETLRDFLRDLKREMCES